MSRYPEEVEMSILEQSGVRRIRIKYRVWKNFLCGQPSSVNLQTENDHRNLSRPLHKLGTSFQEEKLDFRG